MLHSEDNIELEVMKNEIWRLKQLVNSAPTVLTVTKLEPQDGDLLLFRVPDGENGDSLFPLTVHIKQLFGSQGKRVVLVVINETATLEDIPAAALTEQGYLRRSDVQNWVNSIDNTERNSGSDLPLGMQFIERFPGAGT